MPIIFFSFFSMKSFFFPAKLPGLLSAEISRGRICWNWWRIEDWYDGSDWFPPDFLNKPQGIKELRGCQQLWKYLQALPLCVLMVAQVGLLFYFFLCSINAGEKTRGIYGWDICLLGLCFISLVCGLWGLFEKISCFFHVRILWKQQNTETFGSMFHEIDSVELELFGPWPRRIELDFFHANL